jgi:uncharacterized membrane protein
MHTAAVPDVAEPAWSGPLSSAIRWNAGKKWRGPHGEIEMTKTLKHRLHHTEVGLLGELRDLRRVNRCSVKAAEHARTLTLGQKIADQVAATMGSWRFIIAQSIMLAVWIVLNVAAFVQRWDPYPFILLNLALSFQAAYAAPFIMMAQNRQQDIDRKQVENDYQVNIKAELEIELLHQKFDELRETEVLYLTSAVRELTELLGERQVVSESPPAGE